MSLETQLSANNQGKNAQLNLAEFKEATAQRSRARHCIRQSSRGATWRHGATYLPEAGPLAQAGQLPLHAAVPPARRQPALGGEEPAVSASREQLFHHHVADVPGGRRPTVVVPQADRPEWAQRDRDTRTQQRTVNKGMAPGSQPRGGRHTSTSERCAVTQSPRSTGR